MHDRRRRPPPPFTAMLMPTTMPRLADRVPAGGWRAIVAALAACALAAVSLPAAARADGDPASDVLL
jgi:hypothetical protein